MELYMIYFLVILLLLLAIVLLKYGYGTIYYCLKLYFSDPKKQNNYRLSDMLTAGDKIRNSPMGLKYHFKHYPNSIVSKYYKKTKEPNNLTVLQEIVDSYKLNNSYEFDCIIIHLRLGEVIEESDKEAKEFFEKYVNWSKFNTCNYIKPKKYYEKILEDNPDIPKKVLIFAGGCFTKENRKSLEYIDLVKNFLISKKFEVLDINYGNGPDDDFVTMCRSKYFIQSGGGFSRLVSQMVERKNGIVLS